MRALQTHERGGPEHPVEEEAPVPTPGTGDALVRVHAARAISRGLFPGDRRLSRRLAAHGAHHPAPRSRAHLLVHGSVSRAERTARRVAAYRLAGLRERASGA